MVEGAFHERLMQTRRRALQQLVQAMHSGAMAEKAVGQESQLRLALRSWLGINVGAAASREARRRRPFAEGDGTGEGRA